MQRVTRQPWGRHTASLLIAGWAVGALACGSDSGGGVSVSEGDTGMGQDASMSADVGADAAPEDTASSDTGGAADTAQEDTREAIDSAPLTDLPGPETCGNGRLDPDEQCDGRLFGASCEDAGFLGGDLDCLDDCQFDTSECFGDSPVSVVGKTMPSFLHFTRDGSRLIFMEPDPEAANSFSLNTLDLEDDTVTSIDDGVSAISGGPVLGGVYPITLDATGRWATFMKEASRQTQSGDLYLWDMTSAEAPTQLGDDATNQTWFSEDGAWLAWRQYRGTGVGRPRTLQLRDTASGETVELSGDAKLPRFGFESEYMIYFNITDESFSNAAQLVRRDLSDGEEVILSERASSEAFVAPGFSVSADGRRVAFLTDFGAADVGGTLQVLDWETMETTTLDEGVYGSRFSPSGRYLSYSSAGDVTVATVKVWDAESGETRTLGDGIARAGVSFDDAERFGAYLEGYSQESRAGTLVVFDLESGERVLTEEEVSGLTSSALDWIPGSRLIFYRGVTVGRYLGAAYMWSEGAEATQFASDVRPGRVWPNADGSRVLLRRQRNDTLHDLVQWRSDDPSQPEVVVERMINEGLTIHPDHTFALALVEPSPIDLRTIDLDGRELALRWLVLVNLATGESRPLSNSVPPYSEVSGVSTEETDWTVFTTMYGGWAAFTNIELDGTVTIRKEPLR